MQGHRDAVSLQSRRAKTRHEACDSSMRGRGIKVQPIELPEQRCKSKHCCTLYVVARGEGQTMRAAQCGTSSAAAVWYICTASCIHGHMHVKRPVIQITSSHSLSSCPETTAPRTLAANQACNAQRSWRVCVVCAVDM